VAINSGIFIGSPSFLKTRLASPQDNWQMIHPASGYGPGLAASGSRGRGAHAKANRPTVESCPQSALWSAAPATSIDGSGQPRYRVASPLVAEAEGTLGVAPTAGAVATQAPTAQALATQAPTAQALATQAPTAQAVTTQTPTAVPMVRVPPAMAAGLVGPRVPRERQYRGRPCPAHQRARILPTGA